MPLSPCLPSSAPACHHISLLTIRDYTTLTTDVIENRREQLKIRFEDEVDKSIVKKKKWEQCVLTNSHYEGTTDRVACVQTSEARTIIDVSGLSDSRQFLVMLYSKI